MFELDFFNTNKIPLDKLVNTKLVGFMDGRAIMLLLDAYLKSEGVLLDSKGRFVYEGATIDFRFYSGRKIDLRPSSAKGIGREGIIKTKQEIDLFFIVSIEDDNLILSPYIPSKGETFLCQEA